MSSKLASVNVMSEDVSAGHRKGSSSTDIEAYGRPTTSTMETSACAIPYDSGLVT